MNKSVDYPDEGCPPVTFHGTMIRDPEVISIEGWLSRQPGRLAIDLQNYCLNYLQVSKHGDGFFPIFLGRFSVQIMRTVKLRFGRLDPNFIAENPINHPCSLWLINLWPYGTWPI